jgi:hypothetical protein
MEWALLEFVLLSHADLIIHSFGSSFGEEAAGAFSDVTLLCCRGLTAPGCTHIC